MVARDRSITMRGDAFHGVRPGPFGYPRDNRGNPSQQVSCIRIEEDGNLPHSECGETGFDSRGPDVWLQLTWRLITPQRDESSASPLSEGPLA